MTGSQLRAHRERLGLTQTALAAFLGMNMWTIAQWESGRRPVGMDDFALRAALATAERMKEQGGVIPDWRKEAVLPPGELAIVRSSVEDQGEQG